MQVPTDQTTQIRATATDAADNESSCSAPIGYTHASPTSMPDPTPDPDPGTQPPADSDPIPTGDIDPPEGAFTKKPRKRSKDRTPTFTLASDEFGSTFLCQLDSKPQAACEANPNLRVKPGKHTLKVVAVDPSGNADPTPASFTFTVRRR